jgi:hypothetical protein
MQFRGFLRLSVTINPEVDGVMAKSPWLVSRPVSSASVKKSPVADWHEACDWRARYAISRNPAAFSRRSIPV